MTGVQTCALPILESVTERLSLYTRLDNCENEEELLAFATELQDRFGPIPKQVVNLFDTVRSRKLAVELGFEKMILKDEELKCYFINRPDSPYFESAIFQHILAFIQAKTNKARLKQTNRMFTLIVQDMKDMQSVVRFLASMREGL